MARLAELYLQAVEAEPAVSPRWREDVRGRLSKHIIPKLGRLRVHEVDAYTIRRFARALPAKMRAKTFGNVLSVNVLRAWQTATTKTLGQRVRLHDLRTTFASRLVEHNVDVATAQALLRHAQPSTTLNAYTRMRGDADARLERMRKALDAAANA